MPVFTPPIVLGNPPITPDARGIARRLGRYLGPQPVGRSVLGIPDSGLNLLSAEQMSMEGGIAGWIASFQCTIAQSSAQAVHGAYSLAMTSTGPGTIQAQTANVAVSPSTQYTGLLSLWAPATGKGARLTVYWYAADGTTVVGTSSSAANSATGWTSHAVTATSPATAAYASVMGAFQNTTAGQVYHADMASLRAGALTTWTLAPVVYSTVDTPDQLLLATASEVYLGGHVYVVSDAVASALTAAGYEVT